MRKLSILLISIGALLAAGGIAAVAGSASEGTTQCDGRQADIVIEEGTELAYGTPGDDLVILPSGTHYSSNGGTDTLCNSDGVVEATFVTDDPGPSELPTEVPPRPELWTIDAMENGELPQEWDDPNDPKN